MLMLVSVLLGIFIYTSTLMGFREEAWGNFKTKNCFLYSYEDHSIAKITEGGIKYKMNVGWVEA